MAQKRERKKGQGKATSGESTPRKRSPSQGEGRAAGKRTTRKKKPVASEQSVSHSPKSQDRGKKGPGRGKARRKVAGSTPPPSRLAAGAPHPSGRAEPPWVGDLRQRWQSVSPARRRKVLDQLSHACEPADPQQRLERLNGALAALDMDPTDVTCLVIALYYDWLIAGRADVVGQIAVQIQEVLSEFESEQD